MRARTGFRLFLATVLLPLLALPAYNLRDEAARNHAKRLLDERRIPRLQQHLFNVDFLVGAWSALTWRSGLSTDPLKAVVGYDGWLFMGDRYSENLTAQRWAEAPGDVERAAGINHNLLAWDRWLRSRGVKGFVLQIGPDKHRVHADHLPGWARLGRPPRVELLTRGVASHLMADPTQALIRVARSDQPAPYYKTDSHWNLWGAAIAMDDLRRVLNRQGVSVAPALPEPPQVDRVNVRTGGDLSAFLRIQNAIAEQEPIPLGLGSAQPQSDIRDLNTQQPVQPASFGQLQFPRLTLRVTTPGAANPLKVLWLRDSFGSALSPFFAAHFQETVQLHWSYAFDRQAQRLVSLVNTHQPDLVVITLVERVALAPLLLTPPPTR